MTSATQRPRAAVIGSGFGGLSAAIRLQHQGFDVTVFEKRDQPGGRAYVYRDQGFTFDAGPTVITAPQCLEELFALSGRKMSDYVELLPVAPFYRLFWEDGYRFDYSADADSTFDQIRAKNPADEAGYRKFLAYSKEVFDKGYTELVHVPFPDWWSMIRVSPDLVRLGAYRSVYAQVARFIQDPQLRQAFSFHSLLVGGNPFSTSAIYTLIHYLERNWGVFFPKGGTGALVAGLVRLLRDLGGKIELNAGIARIVTEKGRVVGVQREAGPSGRPEATERFDLVVSNADVKRTYADLLRDEPAAAPQAKRLSKMNYSMSLFLIYFGARKRYENLAHHNVVFGPRYEGLLRDIFKNPDHKLADDFSLYLHAPHLTDPGLAPPGQGSFYVLSPVPHLGNLEIDWKTEGPRYADRILKYLEERYMPGLRSEIVTQRIFTPDDFDHELGSHLGAAFSLEPTLTQSAYFRTHNRDDRIPGLYFVGAGTHPGAGVPGVVNSAKATAGVIAQDWPELGQGTSRG